MRPWFRMAAIALFLIHPVPLWAQAPPDGTVSGSVADQSTHGPLENANVVLRSRADSTHVIGTTTLKDGSFALAHVPWGTYALECGLIGHTSFRSPEFALSAVNPRKVFGTIALKPSTLMLDEVAVRTERSLFNSSIELAKEKKQAPAPSTAH